MGIPWLQLLQPPQPAWVLPRRPTSPPIQTRSMQLALSAHRRYPVHSTPLSRCRKGHTCYHWTGVLVDFFMAVAVRSGPWSAGKRGHTCAVTRRGYHWQQFCGRFAAPLRMMRMPADGCHPFLLTPSTKLPLDGVHEMWSFMCIHPPSGCHDTTRTHAVAVYNVYSPLPLVRTLK